MLNSRLCGYVRGPLTCWVSCLSLVLLLALGAAAQAPTAAPAAYGALIDQAFLEYEARNFPEARALFSRAHAIYPNARVLRSLGMVEFELRHYADSAALLEQALASTVLPLTAPLRDETQALLARARGFVVRLRLNLEPRTTNVLVDGASAQLDTQSELLLEVGDHTLEFRAPGYVPERRLLKVKGGDEAAVRVVLTPEASAPVGPAAATPSWQSSEAASVGDVPSVPREPVWFVVPRLTLLMPGKGTTHYDQECSPSACPPRETPASEEYSHGAAPLLGVDVMFAPLSELRVGLGLHMQLNTLTQEYENDVRWEAGRTFWLPISAEYRIRLNDDFSLPLRVLSGLTLLKAGVDAARAGESNRDFCKMVSEDGVHCKTWGPPGIGAIVGAGPGLSFSLGKVALRADLWLGYSFMREHKMERRAPAGSRTDKVTATGVLAALALGVEL